MMDEKTLVQLMYAQMKKDCNNDTETVRGFVKFLHEEKNQAKYLLEIKDLGVFERDMIKQIIGGRQWRE